MDKFDIKNISFGCELEWSDIDRSIDIPKELGSWEGPKIAGRYTGSEIDIVNTRGKWRGHGTCPLAMKCPVGGEIHVNPSKTVDSQFIRILRILDLFPVVDVACTNHGHIHVGVPGLLDDLETLKNIFRYTRLNEKDLIHACVGYSKEEAQEVRNAKLEEWSESYLLCGDGKQINPELYEQVEKAKTVDDVLYLLKTIPALDYFADTQQSVSTENSHRTAVNLYNLTRMETIEFRIFRASINPVEIYSSLKFVERYMEEAVKGEKGKPVLDILRENEYKFAQLNFEKDLVKGWEKTRASKGACGCLKKSQGYIPVTEDGMFNTFDALDLPLIERSSFETGLYNILVLCKLDFIGEVR